ncbi:MAG: molybdate ABC transporter substrate-binding protein [Deltaproteobacteria bacterium]|nr:molybdate ABC transporter substrate-binding protein [Deltaproteobacteria bacterium]
MKRWMRLFSFFTMILFVCPFSAAAQEKISAAVAANYIAAFKDIASAFEEKTGIKVEATFASTGSLYAQIQNGAPYDIYLAADEDRPVRLHKEGIVQKPFVYARGRCVLWSVRKDFCRAKDWREALKGEGVKRIALANPQTAPYGAAAREALLKAGLWEALESKRVIAQTVAQAFQYASTEATDAGFCALSSVVTQEGAKGCCYPVEEAPQIVQSACVLTRSKNRPEVERFAAFLLSPESGAVKTKFGYQ